MKEMFVDKNNDSMAFLRGNDLRELLLYVQNYLLVYRDSLGLPAKATFGLELEYENLGKNKTDIFVTENLHRWDSDSDGTVASGGEVRSPILYDSAETWKSLKMICNFLRENGATTMNRAGGHIHVGSHVLGSDMGAWADFLKLYTAYEHVLFRFFYGDKINERNSMPNYASPVASSTLKALDYVKIQGISSIEAAIETYFPGKYNAVNFGNVDFRYLDRVACNGNTIEFRAPNATVNEVVEQNNINVCTKMLVTAKNKVMDTDFLDYKIKKEFLDYNGHEYLYNEICLKDALEFVDLVFDHNIDKIYFLRQYLKDFSDNFGLKEVTEAKRFYKV